MKALTFLIADDFPGNLKLLRVGLESEGHQVIEAANGLEALAVLDQESVDAVISDILMPSMDGFRLCSEIRRSTKDYRNIPVILYTATYDSLADRTLADSVGADAYMLKPAPAAALIAAAQDARHKPSRRPSASVADEADVLKHYNAALVHKLETRSNEVQDSLAELQSAHRQIVEMNQLLETRVAQRTAALDTANKELEAFAFSVSHDLQAPLRRISGFAQLLKDSVSSSIDSSNREMLGHVIDASTQMSQLIDALLAFARTSRTEMHFAEVDLDILADKVIDDLHDVCRGRIIEWRRTPLPKVRGDAILLHQVLVNLLSNAVKYTRTRDKAVIEIRALDGHDNETVVSISDNGVGFDMRYAAKLFGVFQRMHRADEFEGTGVGLANAQRIVTRHGGSIWANASLGSGATFCVSLPRS
jgi:signal transduction histidine kinase